VTSCRNALLVTVIVLCFIVLTPLLIVVCTWAGAKEYIAERRGLG
jgi:outer membrane lipoprotein-sorting protein